jgi:hypothetical protein
VPIVLRHHEVLELNRIEYAGTVTCEELLGLARFQAKEPVWLGFDCLNLIQACANFDTVLLDDLDGIFAQYRALFAPLNFHIARRSAWICRTEAARGHLSYWLFDRDTKSLSSVVREFESFAEAGEWLVLNDCEARAAERGLGFADIVRLHFPPLARAV